MKKPCSTITFCKSAALVLQIIIIIVGELKRAKSLSHGQRTEVCSFLKFGTCLHTSTYILWCFSSQVETISLKISPAIVKFLLPVSVSGSNTSCNNCMLELSVVFRWTQDYSQTKGLNNYCGVMSACRWNTKIWYQLSWWGPNCHGEKIMKLMCFDCMLKTWPKIGSLSS